MKQRKISETILSSSDIVSSTDSTVVDLDRARGYCVISEITATTPVAKTFDSGALQTDRLTCLAKASCGDGDYAVVYDMAGDPWAIAFDKTGSSPAPTGAVWTAIAAGHKAQVDISGCTDAASVGTAVAGGFTGLTGFAAVITQTDNLDGTVDHERVTFGIPTASVDYNSDDSGTGTMAWTITAAGVASEIDLPNDKVTVPTHGFVTGLKGQLTTTGTLPTGLSTSTDYFIINLTSSTVAFADTLAHAVAGTKLPLSGEGTGVHTFTPTAIAGAIKLQGRLESSSTYVDIPSSSTSITGSQNNIWNVDAPYYRYVKVNVTPTAGKLTASVEILVHGEW